MLTISEFCYGRPLHHFYTLQFFFLIFYTFLHLNIYEMMYHWSSFLEKISQVMLVMEMHFKELNTPSTENKIKNPLK